MTYTNEEYQEVLADVAACRRALAAEQAAFENAKNLCAQYLDQRDAEQAAHAETRRERDEWQRQASLLASDRDDVLRSFKREQSEAAQAYRTIRDLYDVQAETIARLTDVFDVCREYFYCDPHTLSQAHHDRATAAINAYEATQPAEPPGDARLP